MLLQLGALCALAVRGTETQASMVERWLSFGCLGNPTSLFFRLLSALLVVIGRLPVVKHVRLLTHPS